MLWEGVYLYLIVCIMYSTYQYHITSPLMHLQLFITIIIMKNSKPSSYHHISQNQHNQQQDNDISSAKYSDISSFWLKQAKNMRNNQLNDISLTPINNNNKRPILAKDQLQSSSSLTQYFYQQDSLLSINQLFPQQQFRSYAKQLQINAAARQSIVYKFYSKNDGKHAKVERYDKYYTQYLQWKQNSQQASDNNENAQSKVNAQNNNKCQKQVSSLVDKQLQLQNYKSILSQRNEQISKKQMKLAFQKLSQQYNQKLKATLYDKKQQKYQIKQYLNEQNAASLKKNKKLTHQTIPYPMVTLIDQQKQLRLFKQQQKIRQAQMRQKSYIDIIKNPPKNPSKQQTIQIPPPPPAEYHPPKQNKKQWKLDIDEVLKIPYKKFLLFYQQYQNKIIALCTPQQLKKINKYRKQALQRQQALKKLKNKISQYGKDYIDKLHPEKRQQLFQLLYQDEVEKQKQKLQRV